MIILLKINSLSLSSSPAMSSDGCYLRIHHGRATYNSEVAMMESRASSISQNSSPSYTPLKRLRTPSSSPAIKRKSKEVNEDVKKARKQVSTAIRC